MPAARLDDFTRSMRIALWWQVGVFGLALVLVLLLPSVKLEAGGSSPMTA